MTLCLFDIYTLLCQNTPLTQCNRYYLLKLDSTGAAVSPWSTVLLEKLIVAYLLIVSILWSKNTVAISREHQRWSHYFSIFSHLFLGLPNALLHLPRSKFYKHSSSHLNVSCTYIRSSPLILRR